MAITVVTSIVGTAVGGNNVTLALGSTAIDDIVVTFGGFAGGTATAPGVISPTGYASVWVNDSAALDTKLEWKRLTAADPSVLLSNSGDAADAVGYVAYVLRGVVPTGSPFQGGTQTSIATGVPNVPSIVTVTAGAIVLALGANDINDTSPGVLTRFNANVGGSSNDTDDQTVGGAASIIAVAGSTYASVWTTWASGVYNTVAVALTPASVATGNGVVATQNFLSVLGAGS